MSAAVASLSPRIQECHTPSPSDFVRSLTPEDKQSVFLLLLREALAINGDAGLLPIEDESGDQFGYYVPPKAARIQSDRMWQDMPAGVREALSRPVSDLNRSISSDELLAGLSSEADSSPR